MRFQYPNALVRARRALSAFAYDVALAPIAVAPPAPAYSRVTAAPRAPTTAAIETSSTACPRACDACGARARVAEQRRVFIISRDVRGHRVGTGRRAARCGASARDPREGVQEQTP